MPLNPKCTHLKRCECGVLLACIKKVDHAGMNYAKCHMCGTEHRWP